jgi:hypothetical protein
VKSSGFATIPDAVFHVGRRARKCVGLLSSSGMMTRGSDLVGGFPGSSRTEFRLSDFGAETFPRSPLFLFRCVYRARAREAGLGRLPGAGGQAVRALAVTARATAWLVAAESARMTTRVPVMVFAVSLGAIQMTRQPEATRRVMSFWPSACWVPL